MEFIYHKGDHRELLKTIVGETVRKSSHPVSIVLGDTNITESPGLELQVLAQEMSNETRRTVRIVMRKVKVSKMRIGGPLSNTQIYKSYLPVSEQDGMMVIVIGEAVVKFSRH